MLAEAARLLADDGRLCLSGLSHGRNPLERGFSGLWSLIRKLRPLAVDGCRPLRVADSLAPGVWCIEGRTRVARFGVPSEVVIARRRARR